MRNLRAIIAASIATLTILLSGCGAIKTMGILFDPEARENLGYLKEISRNYQASPGYYKNSLFPDSPEYTEKLHSLTPEQLNQEIINQYLKRAKSKE